MDIATLREFCLGLGGVTEKTPFGGFSKAFASTLAFYVSGHMFCITDIDHFTFVEMKASPDTIEELAPRHEDVTRVINPTLRGWIHIDLGSGLTDPELCRLIRDAYSIVKAARAPRV